MIENVVQKLCEIKSIANENGGPKIMENVVKNEWKQNTNAKCTLKIMQNVVKKIM